MNDFPEDLADVDRRLHDARPDADPAVLSRASQRARTRVGRLAGPTRALRLAMVALLVGGFTVSGAGAGLALSGIGGQQVTSGQDQYDQNDDGDQGVKDENDSGSNCPKAGASAVRLTLANCPKDKGGNGDNGVKGESDTGNSGTNGSVGQQVEAGSATGNTLPFTGWAALPIFALGLALLTAGVVLRRRTAER